MRHKELGVQSLGYNGAHDQDERTFPMVDQTKTRTIAVIDGNSLMHRAFHAVPPTMNAPDGTPTNAIFGFLSMFLKMVDSYTYATAFNNAQLSDGASPDKLRFSQEAIQHIKDHD